MRLLGVQTLGLVILLSYAPSLLAQYQLSGTVRGGEQPLDQVSITLYESVSQQLLAQTSTDQAGAYTFDVPSGSYDFYLEPQVGSGFQNTWVRGIQVSDANLTRDIVLLPESITFSGRLLYDTGEPILYATVIIRDQDLTQVAPYQTTGTDGTFSFDLSPGTYKVYVDCSSSQNNGLLPGRLIIRNLEGDQVLTEDTDRDFLFPIRYITGQVTDVNGDPVADVHVKSDQSINGADGSFISVDNDRDSSAQEIRTDADGFYTLPVWAGIAYPITFVPPEAHPAVVKEVTSEIINVDTTLNVQLQNGYILSGTVRYHDNVPMPNAHLRLFDGNTGDIVGEDFITLADGRFSFSLEPGTYSMKTWHYRQHFFDERLPSTWRYDQLMTTFTLDSDLETDLTVPFKLLTGQVTDPDGNPVADVDINFSGSLYDPGLITSQSHRNLSSRPRAVTDTEGRYSVLVLPTSDLECHFIPPQGSQLASQLFFRPGLTEDTVLDIQLNPGVPYRGTVVDEAGNPIPYAEITLEKGADFEPFRPHFANADGTFDFMLEADEVYVMTILKSVFNADSMWPQEFIIRPYQTYDLLNNPQATFIDDITIPIKRLYGRALDSNGVGVPGVIFTGYDNWWHDGRYHRTEIDYYLAPESDQDGNFVMSFLAYDNLTQVISPPSGSGFASTVITGLDMTEDISQDVILTLQDETPPLILSGPVITNITQNAALVLWQTNEPATSQVAYGTQDLTETASQPGLRTQHALLLTDLTPDTTYQVQAQSSDARGNGPTTSNIVSFTTLADADEEPPLIVEGPVVTFVDASRATIEWTTNEATTATLDYGIDSLGENSVNITSASLNHRQTLLNLEADTLYQYQLTVTDLSGNATVVPNDTFRTLRQQDTSAPLILAGPVVLNVSQTTALIGWTTNEPADSGVSYNDGTAFGVAEDDALVEEHLMLLTDLTPGTTYSYRVASRDAAGNGPTISQQQQFTTLSQPDTEPPTILEGPLIVNVTHQSVVIRWRTNEPADSLIEFGLSPDQLDQRQYRSALVENHNLPITGLQSGTTYYFRVLSTDAQGNGPTASAVYSFTTRTQPNRNPPNFTQTPSVNFVNDRMAVIVFATDRPTRAVLGYSANGAYQGQVTQAQFKRQHRMTLTGLTPNQAYTFDVNIRDASGLENTYSSGNTRSIALITDANADITAPVATTAPYVASNGSTQVLMHMIADEPASISVTYKVSGASEVQTAGSLTPEREHLISLNDLTPSQSYSFTIQARDLSGNSTTWVSDQQFTSLSQVQQDALAAPQLDGDISWSAASDERISLSFASDVFAQSKLHYGPLSDPQKYTQDHSNALSHSFEIVQLEPGLTYATSIVLTDLHGKQTTLAGPEVVTIGQGPTLTQPLSTNETEADTSMQVAISLVRASQEPITFDWTLLSDTATAGEDFVADSGQVTLAPGQSSVAISINLLDDSAYEGDEQFQLQLRDAVNAAFASSTTTITIVEDEFCASIEQQPVATLNACAGTSLQLDTGLDAGVYSAVQWYRDGQAIASATSLQLQITNLTAADAGSYQCQVRTPCGQRQSQTTRVSVTDVPASSQIAGPLEICLGSPVSYSSVNSADAYDWILPQGATLVAQSDNRIEITFSQLPAQLGLELHNDCGSSAASYITIDGSAPAEWQQQPQSEAACIGENVQLTAQLDQAATYQWYHNGSPINGANLASLAVTVTAESEGEYYLEAVAECGTTQSQIASVSSVPVPQLQGQSASQAVCVGADVQLQVQVVEDQQLDYQWYHDDQPIPSSNTPNLALNQLTESAAGVYYCEISGACSTTSSKPIWLSVDELQANTQQSTASQGLGAAVLYAEVGCEASEVSVQWRERDSGTLFTPNQNPVHLPYQPTENTWFEVEVYDAKTGNTVTATHLLLVPGDPQGFDINGDGCNDINDLIEQAAEWVDETGVNLSGDRRFDIRDLLYINTTGGCQ